MTVREATLSDIEEIVEWGRKFHEYSPWAGHAPYDDTDIKQTLTQLIQAPQGAVFISDTGICGGLLFPLYFNFSYQIAQELFWFTEGGGTELREAFEEWAKAQGASAVQMSCLADKRERAVRRLFGRAGYRATETSLLKEI